MGRLMIVLAAVLVGAPALAQEAVTRDASTERDDARARELWENGAILYNEGRYEDAIAAWQEAWRLSERPLILTNIANAQERLGLWQDALTTLNRYRAFAPAEERDALDRRIDNLERRLAEKAATEQATPSAAPPVATPASPRPVLPALLIAGGAGGLGVGGVLGYLTLGAREDATALCVSSGGSVLCPSSAADALRRDRRLSLGADASYVVGAALALGGTLALVRFKLASDTLQATVVPSAGGGVVVLSGGF